MLKNLRLSSSLLVKHFKRGYILLRPLQLVKVEVEIDGRVDD